MFLNKVCKLNDKMLDSDCDYSPCVIIDNIICVLFAICDLSIQKRGCQVWQGCPKDFAQLASGS